MCRLIVAYLASLERGDSWEENGSRDSVTRRVIEAVLSQPAPAPGPRSRSPGRPGLPGRPLGLWVRAKLALRRGDRATAVGDWTAAFTGVERDDAAAQLDDGSKIRLRGELAVMRLSQG